MPSTATTQPIQSTRWCGRGVILVVALAFANVACLGAAAAASLVWPALLTPALLAWTFGLRHAVDADHIASIDNVTRNLMHRGVRSVAVGFWFSIGHSTVVFIMCCIVALTTHALSGSSWVVKFGGVLGTCISAAFLLFIGLLNLVVLADVLWRHWHPETASMERTGTMAPTLDSLTGSSSGSESDCEEGEQAQDAVVRRGHENEGDKAIPGPTGVLVRCCPRLLNMVDKPWKMFFVGFLFGLGFDTSTEIALLAITATSSSGGGVPPLLTLLLPLTFASAMVRVISTIYLFIIFGTRTPLTSSWSRRASPIICIALISRSSTRWTGYSCRLPMECVLFYVPLHFVRILLTI